MNFWSLHKALWGILVLALFGPNATRLMADEISVESLKVASPTNASVAVEYPEISAALEHFQKGESSEAMAQLKAASAKYGGMAPAEIYLADWSLKAKNPSLGWNWLERATIAAPKDPEAYAFLGNLNLGERRWMEARLLLQEAEELLSSFADPKRKQSIQLRVLEDQATLAAALEDWQTAEELLGKLLSQAPGSAAALQIFGQVLFRQDKPDDALEKLRQAAEVDKSLLTPEAILAQWYCDAGDQVNTVKCLEAALETAPSDLATRLAASKMFIRCTRFEDAAVQADAALKLDSTSLEAKILRGNAAMLLRDYPTAIEHLEQAALQSPGNFIATNNLALALCSQEEKDRQRALQYAGMNARRFPNEPEALATLGWVLYKSARPDEAKATLQRAAQSGRLSPTGGYCFARILADETRNSEAKQLLEATLKESKVFFGRDEAEQLLEQLGGSETK